ncbi:ferric reductase-like transmembrane domain-containing protein [Acidimangrovimonas pyrenivorans]|uniref:Ferric reductase-like transmembrane domain-containing protein n=1 Tax=Acidimangrovimonas pyrenivorans TaxID=2030798 RepID=A0ABV7AEP1_9RHOB
MPDGSRRRGLPGPLLALLYVLIVILPIGLAAAMTGGKGADAWVRACAAAGLAAGAMILLQMVSSGRFERLSGRIGIDVTMGFHKWAAPLALVLALAHPLLYLGLPDPQRPRRFYNHLNTLWNAPHLADGRWALLLLLILVALALLRDRLPLRYEVWRMSHAIVAYALVALIVAHALSDGRHSTRGALPFYWLLLAAAVAGPALWVYLRRLLAGAEGDWRLASSRKVADRLWEVTLTGNSGQSLDFRAGQFAWLAFGRHRLPLFDHPFSIASPPDQGAAPRFLIQEAGDFTRSIGRLPHGTRVGIDAPHGSFPLDGGGNAVLLIAGGVGIAPILSLLGDMAARADDRAVRLIYAARSPDAMLHDSFWRPALEALDGRATLLSDAPTDRPGIGQGPLGEAHLRAALEGIDPKRVKVRICGPGPMMTMATDCLHRCGVPLANVDYERFSYSTASLSRRDLRALAGFLLSWAAIAAAVAGFALAG